MRTPLVSLRDSQMDTFVRNLAKLDDRERAKLKRGGSCSREGGQRTHLLLFYQKVIPQGVEAREEIDYFLVASLYPYDHVQRLRDQAGIASDKQFETRKTWSLGRSFRGIRSAENGRWLDKRFECLLEADREQLSFQLTLAIKILTRVNALIDWRSLIHDILFWEHPDRFVQRSWTQEYITYQQSPEVVRHSSAQQEG